MYTPCTASPRTYVNTEAIGGRSTEERHADIKTLTHTHTHINNVWEHIHLGHTHIPNACVVLNANGAWVDRVSDCVWGVC